MKVSAPPQNILLVDDSLVLRGAIADALTACGHGVMVANDGEHALELFVPGFYDVVITDLAMPLRNGLALAAAIKSRAPAQHIVMLSGYTDILPGGGKPSEVDVLLQKPISLIDLTAAIAVLARQPLAA
jgi:CheY-like chemotaxis protein